MAAAPHAPVSLDGLSLQQIAGVATSCELCALAESRRQVVFGAGHPDADLMFVLEAPGYHDDREGVLLAGHARALFDDLLAAIGMSRDDVYLTSVVKCRPLNNRTPQREEVEQCEGYLFHQVARVRPRVICAAGNVAAWLLTGRRMDVRETHGTPFACTIRGIDMLVVPLLHPAVASYTPELAEVVRADFALLPALVRGEHPGAVGRETRSPRPSSERADASDQLSFDVE